MTPKCPTRAAALRFLTVVVLALGLGATATHADAAGAAPANAHMKRDGGGWECNRGYTKQAQSCVAIDVPANAYLDPNGIRWTCNRGYSEGWSFRTHWALQIRSPHSRQPQGRSPSGLETRWFFQH